MYPYCPMIFLKKKIISPMYPYCAMHTKKGDHHAFYFLEHTKKILVKNHSKLIINEY